MALSKGACKYNRQVWEDAEFPILCETCLGDNPYLRMMKERFGSECKICCRPFTTFRWCPGKKMRYKRTEVCQTCSKNKNVCQTCLLDLQYGLPVQVRDNILKASEGGSGYEQDIPKSDVNREYFNQQLEDRLALKQQETQVSTAGKSDPPSDVLVKLARVSPYYKRNAPHVCSFYVKGECKRGEECPYRHEKPTDPEDPLSDQNIKDRYFGVNDPVAEKLLRRALEIRKPTPPEDKSITTVYVGNIGFNEADVKINEGDLKDYFYQFGEIRNISMLDKQNCAFVQFTTREAAEKAVERSYQKLVLHGRKLTIRWGKSQAKKNIEGGSSAAPSTSGSSRQSLLQPVPGLPVGAPSTDYFGLQQQVSASLPRVPSLGSSSVYYPSQDPSRMGSFGVKKSYLQNRK